MQRIDGAYLYDFGRTMRALADMENREWTRLQAFPILNSATQALQGAIYQSIFTPSWRVVYVSAKALLEEIEPHLVNFGDVDTFSAKIHNWDLGLIKDKFANFEAVMKAELQSLAIYHSAPKGGFDINMLIENGDQIFPASLPRKAPEALLDAQKGAKAMGFEMWTAMGFHFHRANEAVLRRYYDTVIGTHNKPEVLTMGTMLSSMEQHNIGNVNIRAAVKNITVFHRNPIAHPDHHIETMDEALALYATIRAAMGYMLDELPEPEDVMPTLAAPALQLTP